MKTYAPKTCVICGGLWTPKNKSQRAYVETCSWDCRSALISRRRSRSPDELVAFMKSNVRTDQNGCHVWMSQIDGSGYGRVHVAGRGLMAHRVAYEMARGKIPEGLVIDHLCRNRACCNPDHLEPVTFLENVRRGERAQRTVCPHGHPYDAANTVYDKKNRRLCRECRRISSRRRRAKLRELSQ